MEFICSNPRHTGIYTDRNSNVTTKANMFNIKEDYVKWCIKNNVTPTRHNETFSNIYSDVSEAYLISGNEWLCKDCLTRVCFNCAKFVGNHVDITNYKRHRDEVYKLNNNLNGSHDVHKIYQSTKANKYNGYIEGGPHVYAWPTGIWEGGSLLGELGKIKPHKGLHQVYVMVDTFDPNKKMKLLVNICGDCYNEDPREIVIMRQELEELRKKVSATSSGSVYVGPGHIVPPQSYPFGGVSYGSSYVSSQPPVASCSTDTTPLQLDAVTTSKIEILSEMNMSIEPKITSLVHDQYTEVCKSISINMEAMKAAYHNLEILKIGGMTPGLDDSMTMLKNNIDKFQKYLDLQLRTV